MSTKMVHHYVYDPSWGTVPPMLDGWGIIPAVAVDFNDHVYVNRRADPAVVVCTLNGDVVSVWGSQFARGAHGMIIRQEDDAEYLYLTDATRHCVVKCTLDGHEVWVLGERDQAGAPGEPFNMPTDITFTPEGDFYVSDGYGNYRVHHFDPDRKLIRSWGEPGTGAGQFSLVHDVWFDTRNGQRRLWVCDREHNRIQIFTPAGEFIEEKTGFLRPNGVWADADGMMYVAEILGRVTILDPEDQIVGTIGGIQSREPGQLHSPHGIWGDSHGNLYVAEVTEDLNHRECRVQRFLRT